MKAGEEDVEGALEYGACLLNSYTFDAIVGQGGKVAGVACRKVSSCIFNDDGVPDIRVQDDSETVIPADTVIFAIGQRPDLDQGFGVELGRGNRVTVESADSTRTGIPGVFAAGDAVTGTVSVVSAIAGGRRAAEEIDLFLGGDGVIGEVLAPRLENTAWLGRDEGWAAQGRSSDDALEAGRCLQCDLRLDMAPTKFWGEYAGKNR
jgi:formate dehydrogenase beta subunit